MIRILVGDAQERLLELPEGSVQSVITDPIWPNVPPDMFPGVEDPQELLRTVLERLPGGVKRLAIVLRNDSDPRFLQAVPEQWPFSHTVMLEYAIPGYFGRRLGGVEVAYLFGEPPPVREGHQVIPSKCIRKAQPGGSKGVGHPCARAVVHMAWLAEWWSAPGETILDPFAGSGTTGIGAQRHQRDAILIEVSPAYAELAKQRIEDDAPLLAEVTLE